MAEIDVSREGFVQWLSKREGNVGQIGQTYSNPVYNWLREQVKEYVKRIPNLYSYDMNVGIRGNTGDDLGQGWYLTYSYVLAHPLLGGPGEYSGQTLLRIEDIPVDYFGIPHHWESDPCPTITSQEALLVL